MGLIQKLKDWWVSIEPINREELEADFALYERERRSKERQTLKIIKPRLENVVRTAFSHIESDALEKLVKRVHRALICDGELCSEASALRDGLMADFFRGKRVSYAFGCEARYFEEQAVYCLNKLLKTNGIHDAFDYVSPNDLSIPAHLLEKFSQFHEKIGWKCVGLDTDSDECVIFVTQSSSYPLLLEIANQSNISITDKPYSM